MALLDSEIARIKAELGVNILTINSEPRIDHLAIFEQVIQPYTQAGASTTSATTVAASTTAAPVTLVLASTTGFAAGARVVIDVDDRQEVVTVQSISGTSMTVLLTKAHSGTYPVTVEGGETLIREVLGHLRSVSSQVDGAISTAGIKRVDDIEFFEASTAAASQVSQLTKLQDHYRDELASLLGIPNFWKLRRGASLRLSTY